MKFARAVIAVSSMLVVGGVVASCTHKPAANESTTPFVFDDGKRALLSPQPASFTHGSWSPTQDDAQRASDGVSNFLKSESPKIAAKFSGYYGQLYGVTDGGTKKIRLSFFCQLDSMMLGGPDRGGGWTQGAILVSDGGDCYFQVDFNPSWGTYSNFRVNGEA
jgi:hypothetical protein